MHLKKLVSAAGLACLGALTFPGCADNRTSLYIDSVLGFESDSECALDVSLSADQVRLAAGTYDPESLFPYIAPLLIGNQLVPQGNDDTLRAETSRVQLEGAVIEIRRAGSDAAVLPAYTSYFGATIQPTESSEPGLMAAQIPLINGGVALEDGAYQVAIRVFGTTLGGKELESGEYLFALNVNNGYVNDNCPDSAREHPCGWPQDGYCYKVAEDE